MEIKKCSKCGELKSKSEFFKTGKQPSGKIKYRGDCKSCSKKETLNWRFKNKSQYNNYMAKWRSENKSKQHESEIRRRYGLSLEEYNNFLIAQNFSCKICGKKHDEFTKNGKLYVDHSHKTGQIRGLLCAQCNIGLGSFKDSKDLLLKAIEYLK